MVGKTNKKHSKNIQHQRATATQQQQPFQIEESPQGRTSLKATASVATGTQPVAIGTGSGAATVSVQ